MLIAVLFTTSLVNAQIKVDSNGKVGIGTDPNTAYNLNLRTMIITAGGPYSDIIIRDNPSNSGNRAIYPSLDFNGEIGLSTKRFYNIWAKYHYATSTLLTSDKRLKEHFRAIDQPLNKILQMNGAKYDFISQGTDTIKNEVEKQKRLKLEKNRLGFIAQDLEKVMPEAVFYFKDEDRYYVDYNAIIPVMVEAMKEQQKIIVDLKNKIEFIEANCSSNNLKSASISPTETKVFLNQNIPNPFNKETRIDCYIPETSGTSILFIYNMNGTQLQQYNINGNGKQSITISGNSLEPGMYLYTLVIDGREVDTKRMILTK